MCVNMHLLYLITVLFFQVLDAIASAKEEATTSTATTQEIVGNAFLKVPLNAASQMPAEGLLKRTVQRQRTKAANVPAEPATLQDLELPEEYKHLGNGDRFLLHDSGPSSDRILVFATARSLQLLGQCSTIFSDGTFSTAPSRLFNQLYTIHGDYKGAVVPLVFALLPNKSEQTYTRLLDAVQEHVRLMPTSWLTDFERAAINVVERNYPGASTGCFFHLQQCVWRKVVDLGLKSCYEEEDGNFQLSVRCLAALAFVPPARVAEYFCLLVAPNGFFDSRALPLATYFEDVWIGSPNRHTQQRDEPMFPIELWNMHQRTLEGKHRTNNAVEGWHRRFQSVLGCSRPSVFRCINALKKEINMVSLKVERYLAGHNPPPSKKCYREVNARLRALVTDFELIPPGDFIRGVAYNFSS